MASTKRVRLKCSYPSLVGARGDELVLLDGQGPATLIVDAASWPPKITTLAGVYTLQAARDAAGAWALHSYQGAPKSWSLRWVPPGASAPTDTEPVPFALPDLGELASRMEPVKLRGELAHAYAIDRMLSFEDGVMLVPRWVGVGERRRPWSNTGGAWHEEGGLPEFSTNEELKRPEVRALRLADGADVVLWDGGVFERRWGGLARWPEAPIDAPWYLSWQPVPRGEDGFFYLTSGGRLVELRRGAGSPREHLPRLSFSGLWPGPGGAVLLKTSRDVLVYDPAGGKLAVLDRSRLALDDARWLWWTAAGLVIGRGGKQAGLDLYPARDVAALARRPAGEVEDELVGPVERPSPALVGPWSASRPRAAACGQRLLLAVGTRLRAHTVDEPSWSVELPAEVVGVVGLPGEFASLDAAGCVRVYGAEDGALHWQTEVAPGPRSLAASTGGAIAVLARGGVWVVGPGRSVRVDFADPIAAAFDDRGALLITGEGKRAALVDFLGDATHTRELPSPPDDVRAVAAQAGGTWLALAGSELLRFSPISGQWTPEEPGQLGPLLIASQDGTRYAVTSGARSVRVSEHGAARKPLQVSYPTTYGAPDGESLSITGLAFLGDGRVLAALDRGRGNIYADGGALKLDPRPGDAPSRWVFVYGGQILVAG